MKFNPKTEGDSREINYMGTEAYRLDTKTRLLNIVGTTFLAEPTYYKLDDVKEILQMCEQLADEKEFILQLAAYARNELYLRSAPTLLWVIAANTWKKGSYKRVESSAVRKYAPMILKRVDQMTEALAMQLALFGKPIPNALKKGIADVFITFDEYQLGKYRAEGKSVTLKDVVKLCHPAAYNKEALVLAKKILDDKLETPYTWETEMSSKSNEDKGKLWDELIASKKLPYMATLRNIRNMVKYGARRIPEVATYLSNENAVMKSRQLPHRYLSAHQVLEDFLERKESGIMFEKDELPREKIQLLLDAINKATITSAKKNIPKLEGKTAILVDNSGSARGDAGGQSKVSHRSVRTMADIGNLLGLLFWYVSDNTYFGIFGDRLEQAELDREAPFLDNFKIVDRIGKGVGQATEQGVFTFLKNIIRDNVHVDRLIVCSDLQIGDGRNQAYGLVRRETDTETVPVLVKRYRKQVNPDFMYYSVCFKGYGNDVVMGEKKVLISGFSDGILKFIPFYEKDKTTQLKYIQTKFGVSDKQ